ncbi:MAG TPA: cytochrome c/FTR1 family iron permease [Burkholderiales bacterium]
MSAKCLRVLPLSLLLALSAAPAAASDWRETAQTAVHMLDYVGVDYPEFVQKGKVLDEDEYKEQLDFAGQVRTLLKSLPANAERARLVVQAERLAQQVEAKAPGEAVTAASAELRRAIIAAYGLVVAPRQTPDPVRGATLYARDCVACHGASGYGDGPAGKGLEPAPSNFHDAARINSRSLYGLYNTITLGVGGTGMASYKQLSETDRWALAFQVSRFALSEIDLARGEAAWKTSQHGKRFPNLEALVTLSTDEVRARYGADAAAAHQWLRANPQALAAGKPAPIQFSIDTLRESFVAYTQADKRRARQLSIIAYLEGFELVEASLDNVDAGLRDEIEREMIAHRNLLDAGAPTEAVLARMNRVIDLLGTAQAKLDGEALSPGATFAASLLILLREGLEAILVLAAIVTFLVKSGRRDALPWVHIGWIAALALGAATWFAATYVIDISGANRELTEGITALAAAAMLLYVGLWLHRKSSARAWTRYISQQVGAALEKRTLWAMAAVAFLAVYRELFEIVLFYQTLWAQTGGNANASLFGGIGVAAALLAALGWVILRYGVRLPIGRFFAVTAILLAMLAVVFTGEGVAALQETGIVGADPVAFIRVPVLGIFPTVQTLTAQLGVLMVVVGGFYFVRLSRRAA